MSSTTPRPSLGSAEFGVGARITLSVMRDDHVDVITSALAAPDADDVVVETGDVSTFVSGDEQALVRWSSELVAAAGRSGAHVAAVLHFSRGCPGEVVCELPGGAGPRRAELPTADPTGVHATAEWALYPLVDSVRDGVEPDHMRDIEAAVDLARRNGTFRGSQHFVTRLEGDVADVIATAAAGWVLVGRTVQHVTSHVTLSISSPSAAAR
ncbi:YkoF family thiamine/hydroxymethylpyrimidine-binding protein [Frigoribacterium sp. PvP032]|uniref:YkoF family thiamine/hydroxymethylpyrimidine-binding protein n=1 Tax=Frigoribacterium sp. PvP032 TaxID=2806589 RepID=UPI001AE8787B|nr:YkoF family thiamine/hydroxymethylpyrimidine-binding protein [Frigoribacterium sp. PvP032]MBP1191034.1 hypothetical protein [Frigoribacterium sp. PvP032]